MLHVQRMTLYSRAAVAIDRLQCHDIVLVLNVQTEWHDRIYVWVHAAGFNCLDAIGLKINYSRRYMYNVMYVALGSGGLASLHPWMFIDTCTSKNELVRIISLLSSPQYRSIPIAIEDISLKHL